MPDYDFGVEPERGMMKTITQKQFKYFCARVDYWLREFGVTDWTVFYALKADISGNAELVYNFMARRATFSLYKKRRPPERTRKSLDQSARHEVGHLLLAPLAMAAEQRFGLLQADIEEIEEGIVCRLTRVLK